MAHPVTHDRAELVELSRRDLEDELVVHLQEHARAEPALAEVARDAEHRDLHDVGRRALDRRVERSPLGVLAQDPVGGVEVAERPAAAEDRLGVAVDLRLRDDVAQIVAHGAEAREVVGHQLLGLGGLDAQLLRQPEGTESVGEAVGHRLDLAPHRRGDLVGGDAEDARADEPVQVLARVERRDQRGVAREVGHDPHLDLRVVGGEKGLEPLAVLERRADLAADLCPDRDVLQVRVG